MPELTPDIVAVKSTSFKGAVPELGLAERVALRILTSKESVPVPPALVQERVKVVLEKTLVIVSVPPETDLEPDQPPEAVQEVGLLVADH